MSDLVVKDNGLLQESYSLPLRAQRVALLAIVTARESTTMITPDTWVEVSAEHYARAFDVSKQGSYAAIAEGLKALYTESVTLYGTYKGAREVQTVRWISAASFVEDRAIIQLKFASDVIPLITRLEKNFTRYYVEDISALTSSYAMRLYELLIQWAKTGKPPMFELHLFRAQLGVKEDEYPRMSNFKARVLDKSVKEINATTNIKCSYKQVKEGRKIVGFTFKFSTNKQKTISVERDDSYTVDMFNGLTDKQASFFAAKLCSDPVFSGKNAKLGEMPPAFKERLRLELMSGDTTYNNDLDRLGLKI
jgi:plasmid replication initiation protein